MTQPTDPHGVRITQREIYDKLIEIDTKVTRLSEARALEAERREDLAKRIDEIESTLKSLQVRVLAWPSLAGVAAIVAIIVAVVPRLS